MLYRGKLITLGQCAKISCLAVHLPLKPVLKTALAVLPPHVCSALPSQRTLHVPGPWRPYSLPQNGDQNLQDDLAVSDDSDDEDDNNGGGEGGGQEGNNSYQNGEQQPPPPDGDDVMAF